MTVQISREVMMDKAFIELMESVSKIQANNQLQAFDIEMLLYKALVNVKDFKEEKYANDVLALAKQLIESEKEAKHDEPNDQS